jgi:hypothetical protein
MSAEGDSVVIRLITSVRLLKGLRNASFRDLAQQHEALTQVHLFLTGSHATVSPTGVLEESPQLKAFREAVNPVPLFLGFAGTALLYLQQQQRCSLQATAADLNVLKMIFDSLASAIQLESSTLDPATDAKQQPRNAAPVEHCSCVLLLHALSQLPKRGRCKFESAVKH